MKSESACHLLSSVASFQLRVVAGPLLSAVHQHQRNLLAIRREVTLTAVNERCWWLYTQSLLYAMTLRKRNGLEHFELSRPEQWMSSMSWPSFGEGRNCNGRLETLEHSGRVSFSHKRFWGLWKVPRWRSPSISIASSAIIRAEIMSFFDLKAKSSSGRCWAKMHYTCAVEWDMKKVYLWKKYDTIEGLSFLESITTEFLWNFNQWRYCYQTVAIRIENC